MALKWGHKLTTNGHKKTRSINGLAANEDQVLASSCDDNHRDRISRLGIHKQRAKNQEQFLYNLADYKAAYDKNVYSDEIDLASTYASKLGKCGNFLLFRNYYTVGQVKLSKRHSCKVALLCCGCAAIRAAKTSKAYQAKVEHVLAEKKRLKPIFITLTVKNGAYLRERMDHLKQAFKTLLNRRRDSLKKKRGYVELSKVSGAVFSYEFTKNEKTGEWHPHIHMFALATEWIDQEKLAQEWLDVTRDSYIVDVRRVKKDKEFGYGKAFAEVCKYALKFSDLSLGDTWDAFKMLKGERLSGSFGNLWGVKLPDNMEDEPLTADDLPYLEMLYKFRNKAGYSLEVTRHVEPEDNVTTDEGVRAATTVERVASKHDSGSDASLMLINDDDEATKTEEERSKDVATSITKSALERLSEHIASYGERSTSRMIVALMPDLDLDVFDLIALEAESSEPD